MRKELFYQGEIHIYLNRSNKPVIWRKTIIPEAKFDLNQIFIFQFKNKLELLKSETKYLCRPTREVILNLQNFSFNHHAQSLQEIQNLILNHESLISKIEASQIGALFLIDVLQKQKLHFKLDLYDFPPTLFPRKHQNYLKRAKKNITFHFDHNNQFEKIPSLCLTKAKLVA